jgi:nicotinamidase-related amidase
MKRILILVDCQNDFCAEGGALTSPDSIKVADRIPNLIRKGKFDAILATMDTHGKNYLNTLEGKYLPVEHCIDATWGYQIREDIVAAVNSVIEPDKCYAYRIVKNTFMAPPAIIGGDLIELVKGDEVYVCGFCTDICVVSNALLAKAMTAFKGAEVFVIADACNGTSIHNHNAALDVMRSNQIQVVDIDQVIK